MGLKKGVHHLNLSIKTMGVTTTIYSVEPVMMKKVEEDNENLAYITGDCEENENWKVASFDFDTSVNTYIYIFFNAGAKECRKLIDSEYADLDLFDYNGYNIWTVSPSAVQTMMEELEALTPAVEDKIISYSLMEIVNGVVLIDNQEVEVLKVADRRGRLLSSDEIRSYLDSVRSFKKFLQTVIEKKNYLLFSEV